MNLAVAATTCALIIPAELPDKTFISCVVLSSRHRPLPVWIGAACALVLQAAIAVVAGRLLELLPHVAVESVISALFIGGAVYLIAVPEKSERSRGEEIAASGEARLAAPRAAGPEVAAGPEAAAGPEVAAGAGLAAQGESAVAPDGAPAPAALGNWRIITTTFLVVALAEFGDVTQVLIANLTARYRDGVAVFVGATVGFVAISAVGVLAGRTITRWVPLARLRKLSGLALLGLGVYSLVGLATG